MRPWPGRPTMPPSRVRRPPGIGRALARRARRARDQALAWVKDPGDAEALHRLHQELRRMRVGLAVQKRTLPPDRARQIARLSSRLGALTRAVGETRDRDVTFAVAGRALRRAGPADRRPGNERVLRLLKRDGDARRRALRRRLRAAPWASWISRTAEEAKRESAGPAPARSAAAFETERARRARRLRPRLREARRAPSVGRWHRLRQAIRAVRTLRSLEGEAAGRVPDGGPNSILRLQRRLGRLHDLDRTLAVWPEGGPSSEEAGRAGLVVRRRALADAVARAAADPSLRRRLRRFANDAGRPARTGERSGMAARPRQRRVNPR